MIALQHHTCGRHTHPRSDLELVLHQAHTHMDNHPWRYPGCHELPTDYRIGWDTWRTLPGHRRSPIDGRPL